MADQTKMDAPTFESSGQVLAHTPSVARVAGHVGIIPERSAPGFLSDRNSYEHRIRGLDSYAFSLTCLYTLDRFGVGTILIRETDTNDVYEWGWDAVRTAEMVPDKYLADSTDPQKYLTRGSALAVWRDHGVGLNPEHPSEPDGAEGFKRASEWSVEGAGDGR